jgi:hypothetical protein
MSWWQNTVNTDQEDLVKQQKAYIRAFYDQPAVLAHLRLIVANYSVKGMTSSEACIAGRALDVLMNTIKENAGVTDEIELIMAEGRIAKAKRIEVKEERILEGYNEDGL